MKIQKHIFILLFFISITAFSQEYERIWQTEIDTFDKLDGDNPTQNGILFIGSSSIRIWNDPNKNFGAFY